MILSAFAHGGAIHLGRNMVTMWNFEPFIFAENKRISAYNYAAYRSACTLASFGSMCCYSIMKALRGRPMPSGWGASGALLASVSCACLLSNPKMGITLFFGSPYIEAEYASKGVILFDSVGLLIGWRTIGHGCHLGGAMVGYLMQSDGGFAPLPFQYYCSGFVAYGELRKRLGYTFLSRHHDISIRGASWCWPRHGNECAS